MRRPAKHTNISLTYMSTLRSIESEIFTEEEARHLTLAQQVERWHTRQRYWCKSNSEVYIIEGGRLND